MLDDNYEHFEFNKENYKESEETKENFLICKRKVIAQLTNPDYSKFVFVGIDDTTEEMLAIAALSCDADEVLKIVANLGVLYKRMTKKLIDSQTTPQQKDVIKFKLQFVEMMATTETEKLLGEQNKGTDDMPDFMLNILKSMVDEMPDESDESDDKTWMNEKI